MKRMTAVLVAMGFSAAAFAHQPGDLTQMEEQSYDRIASGEALPADESAYGYSMSDPYTDGTIVVQEYVLVPADTVVLVPLEDEEPVSHFPG
jgi:hypothetical protein